MNYFDIINRNFGLFDHDVLDLSKQMNELVEGSKFLVIGAAGSIGRATTKEIFKRNPHTLHVVDISENNLAELVRDIRSSYGYIKGDFSTFAIDCGNEEFDALINKYSKYDYILNLSALKHVRSEKDPFTLMRMVRTNILNTLKTIKIAEQMGTKKYFCVSTDKAANPHNMMGATKRIMELFLMMKSKNLSISTSRFANVAFSDGSLLDSFNKRLEKHQPLAAPKDIFRYFITPEESGELCLISCLFGENRDIFFPKLSKNVNLISFKEIAHKFLKIKGYDLYECKSEEEARLKSESLIAKNKWPCYFSSSNTTGEKGEEEFFTENEEVNMTKYKNIGIVKNELVYDEENLNKFVSDITSLYNSRVWLKSELVSLISSLVPNLSYEDKSKSLDEKM